MSPDESYLGVLEVARMLGLHPESVRKLVREGRLPAFKAGRSWRFDRADLEAWKNVQNALNQGGARILVVDDEEMARRVLVRMVERRGYRARKAASGREGLALVAEEAPDVILLDLFMPGMDGAECLERLREDHPALPVVIVTGHPDSDLVEKVMRHPPVLLLSKPVAAPDLWKTIDAVAGRGTGRRGREGGREYESQPRGRR